MKRSLALLILLPILGFSATTTTLLYSKNNTEACTLTSLANASARQCAMVNNDNTTNDFEDKVYVQFKTGATATGTVTVYGYECRNSASNQCTDSGEINGTDAPVTVPSPLTALPLMIGPGQTCPANQINTIFICGFSVQATFNGTVPSAWGIVVVNNSGGAFDGTCGVSTTPVPCGVFYDRIRYQNALNLLPRFRVTPLEPIDICERRYSA